MLEGNIPKRRMMYRSPGTDDKWIPCDTVEDLASCFENDAQSFQDNEFHDDVFTVELKNKQMSDAEVAALPEL